MGSVQISVKMFSFLPQKLPAQSQGVRASRGKVCAAMVA